MSRSRTQLATTYAPGVLFTWEGAQGICRAVPVNREARDVSSATRSLIFESIGETVQSWFQRARNIRAPDSVPMQLMLDAPFYDSRTNQVEISEARDFQLCDPGVIGYVPYPLLYRCGVCGSLREYDSVHDQARRPLPRTCHGHTARWTQVDVVYAHWSGRIEPLSPFRYHYDATRGRAERMERCQCTSRDFRLINNAATFSEWYFVCEGCGRTRDLKQPEPDTWAILESERQQGGRQYEFIEVNMLPVSYRANSAFYVQRGQLIEFRDNSVVELLRTERQPDLLRHVAQQHGFAYAEPSNEEIATALREQDRAAEWDDYLDREQMAANAEQRGQAARAQTLRRELLELKEGWYASNVIARGDVESAALRAAITERGGWARRFDPLRLTVEHHRFQTEHIEERRATHEAVDVLAPDRLLFDAIGDVDAMNRYRQSIGGLLGRLGVESLHLIRGLPICEFSFGYTRVSATPVYQREYNGQAHAMPVKLNAFPELPNASGKRPVYLTQQRNEALYFRLDEARVRRWLIANSVATAADFESAGVGAAYLERYQDFGPFLDAFRDREGQGGTTRTLPSFTYLLLHSFAHQVMHALADVSGLDRDGLGEYIFPADLAFVVYRKGMTPDLGNISATWRNHAEDFLLRLFDPRLLRCGSGSLCDTRGGACPACIMISEVTCIAANQLLSRAVLRGGPAPTWEARGSTSLVGYFEPVIADD
jgi:hypothetical protein